MKRLQKILKILLLVTVIAAALILTTGCTLLRGKAKKLPQSTDTPIYTFVPTQTDSATDLPAYTSTVAPTKTATKAPTQVPTAAPTQASIVVPTSVPTAVPTAAPTQAPTAAPTAVPTAAPTAVPTAAPTKTPEPEITTPYVGNANSKKFHRADCSSVKDMKASNRVPLPSREAAIEKGYKPCQRCNP